MLLDSSPACLQDPASSLHSIATSLPPLTRDDSANEGSVSAVIVGALDRLDTSERARMLGRLLASVGPLGLAVLGDGAFAKYVPLSRLPEVPVSDEDAAHATPSQLADLVCYVQQSDPQLFGRVLTALAGAAGASDTADRMSVSR